MAGKNPSELTAYRQLTDYVKEVHPRQRLFIVHRLDRDTSGVMVFAKTEAAKEALQKNWHSDVKERKYTAMVEGVVNERPMQFNPSLSRHLRPPRLESAPASLLTLGIKYRV